MLAQGFENFGRLVLGPKRLLENRKKMVFIDSEFSNLGQYLYTKHEFYR
jgi:hypothetical protein